MWVCSKYGFFSIVQQRNGEIHVRARVKRDLDNLRRELALGGRVIVSKTAKYRFRLIIDAEIKAQVFHILSESIDYDNFQAMLSTIPDQRDKVPAYHDFFVLMSTFQID